MPCANDDPVSIRPICAKFSADMANRNLYMRMIIAVQWGRRRTEAHGGDWQRCVVTQDIGAKSGQKKKGDQG